MSASVQQYALMQRAREEAVFLRAAGQRTRQAAINAVWETLREIQEAEISAIVGGDTEERFSFSITLGGRDLEGDEAVIAFLRRFGPRQEAA